MAIMRKNVREGGGGGFFKYSEGKKIKLKLKLKAYEHILRYLSISKMMFQ